MTDKQVFKLLAIAMGAAFLLGFGSVVALANILGWFK